jgi:hypothetical protein
MVQVAALKGTPVSVRLPVLMQLSVLTQLLLVSVRLPIPALTTVLLEQPRRLRPVRCSAARRELREWRRSSGAGARSRPGLRVAPL